MFYTSSKKIRKEEENNLNEKQNERTNCEKKKTGEKKNLNTHTHMTKVAIELYIEVYVCTKNVNNELTIGLYISVNIAIVQ